MLSTGGLPLYNQATLGTSTDDCMYTMWGSILSMLTACIDLHSGMLDPGVRVLRCILLGTMRVYTEHAQYWHNVWLHVLTYILGGCAYVGVYWGVYCRELWGSILSMLSTDTMYRPTFWEGVRVLACSEVYSVRELWGSILSMLSADTQCDCMYWPTFWDAGLQMCVCIEVYRDMFWFMCPHCVPT